MLKESGDDFELICQMALTMVEGIGPLLAKKLIVSAGSASEIFTMKKSALSKIQGIGQLTAAKIASFRDFSVAEKELELCYKNEINIVSYFCDRYPSRLKHADDAPLVIFSKGEISTSTNKVIAVVGTRKSTTYGKAFTEEFIGSMCNKPITVVSGLAAGTDTNAHRACLKNKVQTLAVLGHGLNTIYPNSNRELARQIQMDGGGLLTEYRFYTPGSKENFPQRNRIVAAIADALVVVESGLKGGSMITADLANQYGRDVYALPGRIGDHFSQGCNKLIVTHQAAIIDSIEAVITELGLNDVKTEAKLLMPTLFKQDEIKVFELLKGQNLSIDEIMHQSGLPMSGLVVTLMDMEFAGIIRCLPGKIYTLRI